MKTKIHVMADIEISFLVSFNVSGRLYRLLDFVLCATAPKERQSCLGARQEGVWSEWRRGFTYFLTRPAQIPIARLPGRWRRRVVRSEYGICFMPPLWGPEF
jgi:hypothetical protein